MIVYYGGHGAVVDAQLHAICNDKDPDGEKATFPIEKFLRILAMN